MSATDILWPRPRLCYFHSYMIYYINFMCFYHLSRDCCCWCESLSCWGRKQTLPDSLTPTLRPPHPSSSVEIWCIMYVNDTKFHLTLLLHPYDLPQEKNMKAGWYIYTRQFKFIGFIKFLLSGSMSHAQFGLVFCKFPSLIYWWDLLALIAKNTSDGNWVRIDQKTVRGILSPLVVRPTRHISR